MPIKSLAISGRGKKRGHAAKSANMLLMFAAEEMTWTAVVEIEDAGGFRGCDLADAMSEDRGGMQPADPQSGRRRALDREDQRLSDPG